MLKSLQKISKMLHSALSQLYILELSSCAPWRAVVGAHTVLLGCACVGGVLSTTRLQGAASV